MEQTIKDIKLPLDLPYAWTSMWIYLLAGILVVLLVLGVVWFFRKPHKTKEIILPALTAWERAYKRLDNLQSNNLIDRAYLKPFYTDLSDILRRYLEERFSIKAPEMTTEEFLNSLKGSPFLNISQQEILKEFMLISDMVKFAQHESDAAEAKKCFDLVKQIVDQTHGV